MKHAFGVKLPPTISNQRDLPRKSTRVFKPMRDAPAHCSETATLLVTYKQRNLLFFNLALGLNVLNFKKMFTDVIACRLCMNIFEDKKFNREGRVGHE